MIDRRTNSRKDRRTGLYYPELVPLAAIRRYVRELVEKFRPEKVILFGSYAEGCATPDSDVDLLVVMPTRNARDQAVRIDSALDRGFALDLIVRTPRMLAQRLRWGDGFLLDIVNRGQVLYEQTHRGVGDKGGGRSRRRPSARTKARSIS